VSLRGRLSRLGGAAAEPAPPVDPAADRSAVLADLRARVQAVLERTARRGASLPPEVDTVDLPFATQETELGLLHVRSLTLGGAHRVGRAPIAPARTAQMDLLALLAIDPTLSKCNPARALYLDTETTGLAGGTGTVAFLVGLAQFEPDGLRVEQLLVRNLGEEAPMLSRVAERLASASLVVTFNGKSFDLPLLRTRYVMARMAPPREPPHLDLVHVARRLHKKRGVECKLTTLERKVLGFEREGDVPSGEVSACYMHFLRTGDARALLGVIEHNAWDVVAMAALVGLYGEPLEATQLVPDDLVGVARTLKRAGDREAAMRAADLAVEGGAGLDSLRARAEIAKARGDKLRALADFEALAAQVDCARTRLELAKLYEHAIKEPRRALACVEQGTAEPEAARERRLRRLRAKAESC
jgi:uncharacterized protein YprB with RNaseH-like and TPR domain